MNSSRASAFRAVGALWALVFMFTALTAHAEPTKPHESPMVESPPGDTLFQKALGQLAQKEITRDTADILLHAIRDAGQEIVFGPPEIQASMLHPERVEIIVPVSLKASDAVKGQLEAAARSLDGLIKPASYERRPGVVLQIANDPEILEYFHRRWRVSSSWRNSSSMMAVYTAVMTKTKAAMSREIRLRPSGSCGQVPKKIALSGSASIRRCRRPRTLE